jgi:multicomponent Na+:H+ antiporter subunit D
VTSPIDPALLVAVPLVASILPVAGGAVSDRLAWPIAVVTLSLQATAVAVVCATALLEEPVSTAVGGIPEPFGITLVVDPLSAPFVALTAVTGLGVLGYTRRDGPRSGPFYSLYLLLVAGITGVCVTADVFNLYVFLEISGLASYALVAQAEGGEAALAALKYLLLGTVGASLYLLGIGYAYIGTGTLSMATLAGEFAAEGGLGATIPVFAFGLMIVGLGVKAAVFPLHVWKPDAYAAAPPAVAGILSALVSTVAAYAVVRLLLSAFTVEFLAAVPVVETVLLVVGIVSIVAGSLLAFREPDVRRLLAYSSVSQFGIVTVGIALATPVALAGVVIHLVGHAVTKGGFYLAAGGVARGYGLHTVDDYAGLGDRAPVMSGAVAVFALGLIGIPPTVGFAGKLYVLLGTVEGSAPVAGAVVLASTLASLAYFGRLLQRMFVEPPSAETSDPEVPDDAVDTDGRAGAVRTSGGARTVVVLAALLTIALGFGAAELADLVEPTIRGLVS